ncbi:MAG: hypothetical protein B6245_16160 [Desulfobacteraceae bacterium 4572_88]|nr:MAG: hypothetical protein B6245_16160 [Desulfobacteraceae bacterium 4572_88]
MLYYNYDTDDIVSSKFLFAYSQGCIPGNFEEDCMAEHLTASSRNGMFAVVFNSRYGWGARNSTDGASQRYNREFWDAYFHEDFMHLGRLNTDSHEDNAWRISEPCMRWCYYESNLLGDPATRLIVEEDTSTTTPTTTTPAPTTTTPVTTTTVPQTTTTVVTTTTVPADDTFTNSLGMTFNRIPAGTFMMGSPEDEPGRYSTR